MKSTSSVKYIKNFAQRALLVAPILLLPSCAPIDWVKDKLGMDKTPSAQQSPATQDEKNKQVAQADSNNVLMSMNGKAVITQQALDADFDQIVKENPQLQQMLQFVSKDEIKNNLLKAQVDQAVIRRYIEEKSLDKAAEYQEKLALMIRSIKDALNAQTFMEQVKTDKVTDADAKKFYDEQKDKMRELQISAGGIHAAGVMFEKEADAKAFMTKLNEAKGDINKAGQDGKLNVRDFKLVNDQTVAIDQALKNSITKMSKFPATELVKVNDKSYWVVRATSKEDRKYQPFEGQIKDGIKQLVESNKKKEVYEKELASLKDRYQVTVNQIKSSEAPATNITAEGDLEEKAVETTQSA